MAVSNKPVENAGVEQTPAKTHKNKKPETMSVTYPLSNNGRSRLFVAVDGVGEAILIAGEPAELPIPLAKVALERIAQEQALIKKTQKLEQDLVNAQSK